MPKFQDMVTWQQAEILMQPAFIRLIDNLRKQLEQSAWKGTYEDVQVWQEGVSDEVKFKVRQLQAELETATTDAQAVEIEQVLADLPTPFPGYHLRLEHHDQTVTLDMWELCYQICFRYYDVESGTSHEPDQAIGESVEVDTNLLDDSGEVDWNRLDEKTHQLVEAIFARLPV